MQEDFTKKPYLLRAIYEWCVDGGWTPHIIVKVNRSTYGIPDYCVKNGEVALNISAEATSHLKMGNELINFNARFSGKSCSIQVPVANVMACYAAETGQGMAFPVNLEHGDDGQSMVQDRQIVPNDPPPDDPPSGTAKPSKNKSHLKIVK